MNFLKADPEKGNTGAGIGRILIIILLGIGLLLVTLGTGGKDASDEALSIPSEEDRLAELCSSLVGVGRCKVFIAYEEKPLSYSSRTERVIVGVAVICEGGASDGVRARIISLIDSLYGIGTNRIKVDEMK